MAVGGAAAVDAEGEGGGKEEWEEWEYHGAWFVRNEGGRWTKAWDSPVEVWSRKETGHGKEWGLDGARNRIAGML